MAAEHDCDGRF